MEKDRRKAGNPVLLELNVNKRIKFERYYLLQTMLR